MHEMKPSQLRQIIKEVYRVLKPGGVFALVDFHKPTNFLFWPGLSIFLWLFETQTAWQLLESDLVELLKDVGFEVSVHTLHAGGSLQVIQGRK
jgi:demethylmenaquinone methyltransferase/2-methoxy-6-polyprenyl-1,4-benzoquinol methylase